METGKRVGLASLVFVGTVVGLTASGVFGAFSDGYFLGRARKPGVTYKTIARRNAVLGGIFGAVGAGAILFGKDESKGEQISGFGAMSQTQQDELSIIESELRKASKMHASQADRISKISKTVNVF